MIRTQARTARKSHVCTTGALGCVGVIRPGDRYLMHVASPGGDLGLVSWGRLAECANCAELYGRPVAGLSSWWALWSEDGRLLDLITYDTGPVTEAQARDGLGRAVVPLTGTLEAIDRARLEQLRRDHGGRRAIEAGR
ncbi:hypothetical protein [Actinocrinis sp.]|uniref:hypothetical protein n=1 Tax=Actinocrinis sp. TaxID=1920516 RepID=UPI002D74CDCC|nr:hypothetical protein [Actinocrinis sp.]HZP49645.1 hypothetical protein [Actinocrinis sp.]